MGLTLPYFLMAQEEELKNEEVEVIKDFDAKLEAAKLKPTQPSTTKLESSPKNFSYELSTSPVALEYPDPYIRPIAFKEEIPNNYHNIYTKLGYGTANNPLAQVLLTKSVKDYYTVGLNLQHEGIEQSSIRDKNRAFSMAQLYADYYINDVNKVDISLSYNTEKLGLFAFNEEDTVQVNEENTRKSSAISTRIGFSNIQQKNAPLGYRLGLDYDYLKVREIESSENNIRLSGKVDKELLNNVNLGLEAMADFTFQSKPIGKFNAHIFSIKPNTKFTSKYFSLFGAVAFAKTSDETYLLPNIEISVFPNENLRVSAGYNSNIEKK